MTWVLIGFLLEPGVPALTGSQQGVRITTRVIEPMTDRQIVCDVFMGSLLRWTTIAPKNYGALSAGYSTGTAAETSPAFKHWAMTCTTNSC